MMDFDDMERMMGGASYGFGWIFTFLWLILIILAVAALAYWIIKENKSRFIDSSSNKTPVDILKERYAKGDITKEQFEDMKKELA